MAARGYRDQHGEGRAQRMLSLVQAVKELLKQTQRAVDAVMGTPNSVLKP